MRYDILLSDAEYFFNAYFTLCNPLIHSVLQVLYRRTKVRSGDSLGTAFLQRNQ